MYTTYDNSVSLILLCLAYMYTYIDVLKGDLENSESLKMVKAQFLYSVAQ